MEQLTNYFGQNIKDRRIVVTGGTTGIGKAIADVLVSLGGRVLIFGRDHEDFKNAVADLKKQFPDREVYGTPADVTKKEDINKIFEIVDTELGGIDILINNAALAAPGITQETYEDYKYIIDTNITGYLAFAQEAVKRMKEQKSGHIINIGSMSAESRNPESTIYVATKTAIKGFSTSLRKELNPLGIKVSLIEPGAVTSDMQTDPKEVQREKVDKLEMLEAYDIAMSTLFCLSQPKRCDIVSMQIRPHLQII
ncbi:MULTISPECIES: SDR family oxidoreductase [unclassified Flavobacterium]|uniref:SDR family oxidoreductase n=1 Tax=unclassified Flavobacterium TaxID=196869 RepID=UPI00106003EA|nr:MULTISPECIES: SDR family oxidoreductase [unclassified Flavobacterium]TDP00264.1 NADP-dependent 3-hydroxy acid dehydrogenase YdfG [Flavobacterium sp. 245]TDW52129.1 NADP-dependent 3-hydroxy acid dehydrogenase YdfG [Flavobacterium sp. 270]